MGMDSWYPIMSRSVLEDLINKTQVMHSSTREEAAKIIASNQTQLATKLAGLSDITIISSGWANLKTSHKGRHIAPAVMPDDRHVDQQNVQKRCYNISESGHKLEKKQAGVTITKTFGDCKVCLETSRELAKARFNGTVYPSANKIGKAT